MVELEELLTARAVGDPYSQDGSFAANIAQLPPGLRAMAATHWLMIPLLARRKEAEGDPYELVKRAGIEKRAEELDRRTWALDDLGPGKSVIYEAWIRYTRQHPERVFGSW